MNKAYIICRSQTEALMVSRKLEGAGIRGVLTRPPRVEAHASCAYAVRIRSDEVDAAQRRLAEQGYTGWKIRYLD